MVKANIKQFGQMLIKNIKMIVATLFLLAAAGASTFWFAISYNKLDDSIQNERIESMSQIGNIILEKIQLLSNNYSDGLERVADLLENANISTIDEANIIMGESPDFCLLKEDNSCVKLDGSTIVFSDTQAILNGLTDEVTSFFGTVQAKGEYWIFERGLEGVTLDSQRIAGVIQLVESSVYADITTNMIFDNQGATYVVSPTGVILMRPMNADGTPYEDAYFKSFNILSDLEAKGASARQITILREAFLYDQNAQVVLTADGVTWLLQTVPESAGRNILLTVPISITAKDTFEGMQTTIIAIIVVIIFIALVLFLWIYYFYRSNNRIKLEQAKANSKSDFMSKVSHDIRTPLNGIVGMIDIAERSIGKPEEVRKCLNSAQRSSEYLISIINDVLDMNRIESGKMAISLEPFNLHELLSAVIDMNYPNAKLKDIELVLEDNSNSEVCYVGDSTRIKQCLMNLVSNAIKFTNKKGLVTLSADSQLINDSHYNLTISVKDNGIGMSEEFMKNLFLPFEQEKNSTKTSGTVGSGLGLSIVDNLVKLMGGTIKVDSKKNEGSTFIIDLPLEVKPIANLQSPDELEGEESLKGKRVLLVEDNELNRSIATYFLIDLNIKVEEACDGKEGVDKFLASKEGYYDVILMDIQMPVMDGLEATKLIRSSTHPEAKTIPIISLSANAYKEDEEKATAVGMQAHLPKPINSEELKKVLLKVLSSTKKENKHE